MISEWQMNLRIDSEQIKRIMFTALNVKRVDQMVRYKLYLGGEPWKKGIARKNYLKL